MKISFRKIRKFRASLGPVEQAQVVISTIVVMAIVTILLVRLFTGENLDYNDFVSTITVGAFGFMIVFFTLKYGRLLEDQKQELLALKTMAETVNRTVEINYLLHNALSEVSRLLDVEFGWIYLEEGGKLVLRATQGVSDIDLVMIPPEANLQDDQLEWIRAPRVQLIPKSREAQSRTAGQTAKRIANPRWRFGEIEAVASVPLMMKDTFAGIMIVGSKDRKAFSKKEIDLMTGFANQIGVALENAGLFERLRKSEERYMDLFEHSPDMYHIVNAEGIIVSCNQTEADRLGYRKHELVSRSILTLYPSAHQEYAKALLKEIFENKQEVKGLEAQMITKNGELIDVSVNTSIILDESGQPILMRAVSRDITEKKKLEEKIFHAQRIDSIGNLAGGIAHDFNNILTSILGSTAIMMRKLKRSDRWFRFAEIIDAAAKRGAGLTRQLLTFARKSNVQFRPVVVNEIIEETIGLFERSIDKSITVKKVLAKDMCIINGDDGQLQQSILNLLINARDAMVDRQDGASGGGMITVKSAIIDFNQQSQSKLAEAKAGRYVTVSVEDTGVGMDRKIQQRIFEPFFTTKQQGKGTGLGLSVVYGVVNSHDGFITVQSEPAVGSNFSLYFPLLTDAMSLRRTSKQTKLFRGKETVLVIDDEPHVGEVIEGMLKNLGYRVTVVHGGQEGLALYKKKRKEIDVVMLDINMPTMGGKDTFYKLKEIDPNVRVLVSTGYGNKSMESFPLREAVDGFLQKPYQLEELSKALRSVLEKKQN